MPVASSGTATFLFTGFRESRAPWWTAKALRLLGETEDADEIECALGIPTVSE